MTTVDGYVEGIRDQNLRTIVSKLRSISKKSIPRAIESIKWGHPNYSINGKNIASMSEQSKYVNLYFFSGAKLSSKLLEGTGKGMRHIRINTPEDINERAISLLFKQAAKLES